MNKRQIEVQKLHADHEADVIRQLKLIYAQASKDCERKIQELSARSDLENLQSIIWQKQYQEVLKKQLDTVLDELEGKSFITVAEYLTECYETGFLGTLYDLQGQGVPLLFPINQEEVVKAIQIDSKISQGLYKRMGEDTDKLKNSIRTELSRGISNGSSWNAIAKSIAEGMNSPFSKAYNRALGIARTEGHRVQQESTYHCQQRAKAKGADVVKQWDSTLDGVTRPTHVELNGQIREMEEPFEVAGKSAMYPGGFGDPAEDCNCRCCLLQRAKWALSEEEYYTKWNGDKNELVRIKSGTYNEFKDKVKEETRRQTTIVDVSDFGELRSYLSDKYNISLDKAVEELDFESCRSALTGMESVFSEYTELAENIVEVSTRNSGVMCCGIDAIYFNPKYFKNPDDLNEFCDKCSAMGWWVPNSTIASMGVHETGHVVEALLLHMDSSYSYDFEKATAWNKGTIAGEIVSEAVKNVKKTPYGKGRKKGELITAISQYSAKSGQETFAEAFADVYANGEKANPLSTEIKRLAMEKYKMLKGE